jgi:phospholipid/cholesterol/gamma-HCH transport system ATP-binding protein
MIAVNNLSIGFGQKIIHKEVSFTVAEGECVGLVGGSGAGKSVILRSLIGLEKIYSGEIKIEDEVVSSYNESEWIRVRKKVAYVFQNGALFDSMTVFDNLAYPLREHTELSEDEIHSQVISLLNDFNLPDIHAQLPAQLSGGMQKRVGLARAIIMAPKVILYDEPTAGLDPANTVKIQQLILKLKAKGTTSILVTHDMETAINVCDRICLLHKGTIAESGLVKEIKGDSNSFLQRFIRGHYE